MLEQEISGVIREPRANTTARSTAFSARAFPGQGCPISSSASGRERELPLGSGGGGRGWCAIGSARPLAALAAAAAASG
jgi:hypothetical protein